MPKVTQAMIQRGAEALALATGVGPGTTPADWKALDYETAARVILEAALEDDKPKLKLATPIEGQMTVDDYPEVFGG